MSIKSLTTKALLTTGAVAITAGSVLGTMGAASAAVQPKATVADTQITNRLDGGGHGNWAHDTFKRHLEVQFLGKSKDPAHKLAPFMYTAKVTDKGSFLDIPGKFTPNQGGKNHGKHLRPVQVGGPMSGYGQWQLFYASAKAHAGLVPSALKGAKLNALYPSATWPELAFPAGTTFTPLNEFNYDYDYYAVPVFKATTVNGKKVTVITGYKQHWEDSAANGDGQVKGAGNILGLR